MSCTSRPATCGPWQNGLVGQVEAIRWHGRAARDLRERMTDRAARLRASAEQHDVAAEALTRHLSEVDRRKDTIADLERRTSSLRADAHARAEKLTHPSDSLVEVNDDDRQILAFTPPPSGHKDWLTVTIPGL
ncbi:hypothetical protein [Nocardioides alcanivorans]|uniref:hypothetical protein n=1 Tax=Nocardioides alcanivorans TaxID=2897352 RepID=UPI001F1F4D63|nr:hypothetical protein [Nocardioides alcanivorans]